MQTLRELFNREPVAVTAALMALLQALVMLLTSFGIQMTDGQQAAVLGFAAAIAAFIQIVVVRPKVSPVDD